MRRRWIGWVSQRDREALAASLNVVPVRGQSDQRPTRLDV